MKDRFKDLINDPIFREAVYMHEYHISIQHKKEDPKNCPICAAPGELSLDVGDLI